jgi:hypothetical protein
MTPTTHTPDQGIGTDRSRTRLPDGGERANDDRAADAAPEELDRAHPRVRQEDLLDEGVEETFPASDPVSVKRIT